MIKSPRLIKFLGKERISALFGSFKKEGSRQLSDTIGFGRLLTAVGISLLPALSHYLHIYKDSVDITTVFIGVAAVLSMVFRIRHQIPFSSVKNWNRSLSLTHTAFALGCIPTVILILIAPESLIPSTSEGVAVSTTVPSLMTLIYFILSVSVWAGLTEEIIYRGLLISVIRRCTLFKSQLTRDKVAIATSAIIFGLSHYHVWGLEVSLTLVGLGLGFGLAYIAIGELLLPLIVYHIAFDVLSLSFALLVHKM